MRFRTVVAAVVCVTGLLSGTSVFAQLQPIPYVSGLSSPVAFVQDPANSTIQYVVEQGGRIRLIRNGLLQLAPFLDLTSAITSGGERGLLGMALPPNDTTSGRFYVNFTNPDGDTVIARFNKSTINPLVADPATRVDLLWSTGDRVIHQPFANHNGGTIVFGPDGYLYIGMGDGGDGNDPQHNAQNPASLLGKMLRIDVSVPDSDPAGFAIPADNPFRTTSRPEIWSFGLRNPWKFSFDNPARGGTGAMLIADVGQGAWEEVDYEPAARGGRNYGWRNREGAHNTGIVPNLAPAFTPLTDPIFEYSHQVGFSITGGYVYRGAALGNAFRGRYFFGDFVSSKVWSVALTVNPASGEATASDLRDHSAELSPNGVSSFGVDSAGELYVVNRNNGTVVRIGAPPAFTAPLMSVDVPAQNQTVAQPFTIAGWALDPLATTTPGVDAIHIWAYPLSALGSPPSGAPVFVGATTTGVQRPDVADFFGGSQFGTAGFALSAQGLTPGAYRLAVFGLVRASGLFGVLSTVDIVIVPLTFIAVDIPVQGSSVGASFAIGGWALDASAPSGSGIDTIHSWATPASGGSFVFLGGTTTFSDRPDVGAIFGARFTRSGYLFSATSPPPGTWDIYVYARSTATGQFSVSGPTRITVR
jgi:glucose/arabinose dehydrogenase